jgi:hypothetical protein
MNFFIQVGIKDRTNDINMPTMEVELGHKGEDYA